MDLVGRSADVAALGRALDRAASGRRTVVVIRGEPGIGKTSLLTRLRAEAAARGALVLTSSVTEVEQEIGWAGLATLLRGPDAFPIADAALVLGAITGRHAEPVEPLSVASGLADLLRDAALRQPVVVVVDDLHWLDAASAGALAFAIRLLADVSILFVMTARPVRLPIELTRLVDPAEPGDLEIVVPLPLSVGGIHELLERRFDVRLGRVDLVRLHETTGGNPLHVIETGRMLATGSPLAEALVPDSLVDAIEVQLVRIDADHLPVLQAAALMPTIDVVRLGSLFPPQLVAAAIAAGEVLDIVRVEPSAAVGFRHPLLRAGLARRLGSSERRSVHRRLAELATEEDVAAYHWSEAAVGPDAAAAARLEAAAEAAQRRGLPLQAARHAARALELTEEAGSADRARRRVVAAAAALEAGDAQRTLDLLLPHADDAADATEVLRLIVIATSMVTGVDACLPWLDRLVAATGDDATARGRALVMQTRALLYHDVAAAEHAANRALEAAAEARSDVLAADAHAAHSLARFLGGRPVDLDRLLDSIAGVDVTGRADSAASMAIELLVWSDRLDEAEPLLEREQAQFGADGTVIGALDSMSQLIDVHLRRGRLDDAEALIDRSVALARAAGFDQFVALRRAELALVSAWRAEPVAVDLDRVAAEAPASGVEAAQRDALLGGAALVRGDLPTAARLLRAAHQCATAIGLADLGALPYTGNLVEALVATGDVAGAQDVADEMVRVADRVLRGRARAEADRATAIVLSARGELDGAEAAARAAATGFERLGLPIEHGRALVVLGAVLRRRKQRARAGDALRAALAIFDRCGARALSQRAADDLGRLGTSSGDGGIELTATESMIAGRVVDGRRNDEIAAELFITRRTVEANLTRIYRKLGVRSRTELAARLRSP